VDVVCPLNRFNGFPAFFSIVYQSLKMIQGKGAVSTKRNPFPSADGKGFEKLREEFLFHTLLLDTGLLAGESAEIEDTCSAHHTVLVHLNAGDARIAEREYTLYTNTSADLAHGESLSGTAAAALKHYALEFLWARLSTFCDEVFHGDGVTTLELGMLNSLVESLLDFIDERVHVLCCSDVQSRKRERKSSFFQ